MYATSREAWYKIVANLPELEHPTAHTNNQEPTDPPMEPFTCKIALIPLGERTTSKAKGRS